MIDQKIGTACTGCTACMNICPKAAITMTEGAEGFAYPSVDPEICIRCGRCIQVCPVLQNGSDTHYRQPEVYAAWNLDEQIRCSSTSGGVFSALAEAVFSHGGAVAGAVYRADQSIAHILTDQPADLVRLRQSKYAQSAPDHVFSKIKALLEQGRPVLFCGTPCQSAGLQRYLGKTYDALYCCDFICRGVVSQKVYRRYLDDISRAAKSPISSVQFKNKDFGWNRFSTKITLVNGEVYQQDRNHDSYLKGYLKHNLYLRPSCHACAFKKIPRVSDLSLGDFWGVGAFKPSLDADRGTSAVLVSSEKGARLLGWASGQLYMEKRTLEEVTAGNDCLLHCAPAGEFRSYFFRNMERCSFSRLIAIIDEKALHLTLKEKLLRFLHASKLRLKELLHG